MHKAGSANIKTSGFVVAKTLLYVHPNRVIAQHPWSGALIGNHNNELWNRVFVATRPRHGHVGGKGMLLGEDDVTQTRQFALRDVNLICEKLNC